MEANCNIFPIAIDNFAFYYETPIQKGNGYEQDTIRED
jgi:hypothetical protein